MRQVTRGGRGEAGSGGVRPKPKKREGGDRERNREGETEVTRSKLMHGQTVLSPEDKEREIIYERE